jgi:hypothetical protein
MSSFRCPLAQFIRDTERAGLDLCAIWEAYPEARGQPLYHPGMLVALLLYGYSRGVYSSCQLARAVSAPTQRISPHWCR